MQNGTYVNGYCRKLPKLNTRREPGFKEKKLKEKYMRQSHDAAVNAYFSDNDSTGEKEL